MVGALIEGFETMVNLTKENEFIVLEGDEYLSSPIDLRPKFLHYKPNIALISGIADAAAVTLTLPSSNSNIFGIILFLAFPLSNFIQCILVSWL